MRSRLIFMLVVGLGTVAWGQGVGGNSPTYTSYVMSPVYSVPENPTDWLGAVGSASAPVPVELDPAGPAWLADFSAPEGYAIRHFQVSLIDEHLLVQGELPWTGWQMGILTPDFDWSTQGWSPAFDIRINGASVPGLTVAIVGSAARASFDPLPAGTQLEVRARIICEGATNVTDPFRVQQFPAPEPTTLLGFLLLTSMTQRR